MLEVYSIDNNIIQYNIEWSDKAEKEYNSLDNIKKKKVLKAIKTLSSNPYYNSLNCHKIPPHKCIHNKIIYEAWEAYIENKKGAWRLFYCYLSNHTIYLYKIGPHL